MRWHNKLYVGEAVKKQKSKIIFQLEHRKLTFGIYLICLADNGKDLFDIYPSFMIFNNDVYNKEFVGIAFSKEEAFDLIKEIIDDVYAETNSFDVRSYFK